MIQLLGNRFFSMTRSMAAPAVFTVLAVPGVFSIVLMVPMSALSACVLMLVIEQCPGQLYNLLFLLK